MKKKILSVLLSLCMVLTLMPAASGIAWAEETGNENTGATPTVPTVAVDQVTFGYAYDVQRNPAYPSKAGDKIKLSSIDYPMNANGTTTKTEDEIKGTWKFSKVGTYSFVKNSNLSDAKIDRLKNIVEDVCKEYYPNDYGNYIDSVVIYELSKDEQHIAYGIIVAYDQDKNEKMVEFIGDSLSQGAGYLVSTSQQALSSYVYITATSIATDFMTAKMILCNPSSLSFEEKQEEYDSVAAQTVTITNTGNVATGALTITKSAKIEEHFTIEGLGDTIDNIAVGGKTSFTVKPKDKLPAGNYPATVTISDGDKIKETINISFKVTEKNGGQTPEKKSISVSPEKIHFEDATVGYSPVAAQTVKITNTGNVATDELKVKLTGEKAASFKLNYNNNESVELNINSIGENGTETFTVKPNDGLAAGTYNAVVEISGTGIETITIPVSFTVKAASSGGSYYPTIQKPTIITDDGADATLNFYGDKLTIKTKDGYDLADVLLNGISKGKVTEVTGLRTGDKVEVKTAKKQEEPQKPTKEEIIAGINGSRLVARSRLITLDNGKKAIRITWYDKAGMEVNFDGVEVYRSVKKNKGYGKKAFYETKDGQYEGYYINTKNLKKGTRYYYKVRGYVVLDGQKYFTEYSYKAFRTVK